MSRFAVLFAVLSLEISNHHTHALRKLLLDVEIGHVPVAHKVDHVEMSNLFEHSPDKLGANAHPLVVGKYAEVGNICAGYAVRDGGNPADDRTLRGNCQNKVIAALNNPEMCIRGGWIGSTHEVTLEIFGPDSFKRILISD